MTTAQTFPRTIAFKDGRTLDDRAAIFTEAGHTVRARIVTIDEFDRDDQSGPGHYLDISNEAADAWDRAILAIRRRPGLSPAQQRTFIVKTLAAAVEGS